MSLRVGAASERSVLWMVPGGVLCLPGVLAVIEYLFTWLISRVLYVWLQLYTVHAIVLFVLYGCSVLAPFTSILAAVVVGILAATRRLSGKRLTLSVLLVVMSFLGGALIGWALEGKISIPGELD
jgi:hypothetical protein